MSNPTTRDYVGTLMVNASVLASEIRELLDHPQNWPVIAKLSDLDILNLEDEVIAMRDKIKSLRGDFANMSHR